jgi:hypothetical protein
VAYLTIKTLPILNGDNLFLRPLLINTQ